MPGQNPQSPLHISNAAPPPPALQLALSSASTAENNLFLGFRVKDFQVSTWCETTIL